MLKELIKLANELDQKGLVKEADYLDGIISNASERKTFTSHYDEETGELLSTDEWKKRNPPPSERELMKKHNIQYEEDPRIEDELMGMWDLYEAQVERNVYLHMAKDKEKIEEKLQHYSELFNKEVSSGRQVDLEVLNKMREYSDKLAKIIEHSSSQEAEVERVNQAVYDGWYDRLPPEAQQEEGKNQADQDYMDMWNEAGER